MNGEGTCKTCGALVLWVVMHPSQKRNPLDPVPVEGGTIERKRGNHSSEWYGRVAGGAAPEAVMTITDELLDELERKAEKAKPGPWHRETYIVYTRSPGTGNGEVAQTHVGRDAEFIASANPEVVKALVAEVRRLRDDPNRRWLDLAERTDAARDALLEKLIEQALREEREACAALAENAFPFAATDVERARLSQCLAIAELIRARGESDG